MLCGGRKVSDVGKTDRCERDRTTAMVEMTKQNYKTSVYVQMTRSWLWYSAEKSNFYPQMLCLPRPLQV